MTHPMKMLLVGQLARTALRYCVMMHGDEPLSDPCRHFIWSALLYKEFGLIFSQQVLHAHEQGNPEGKEKELDFVTNNKGLLAAKKLAEENKLDITHILLSYHLHIWHGDLLIPDDE